MITKQYWVYSVMGNFGSGKTFWTFLEVSQLDKSKNFIIANVPYKFVDLFYSKPQELYAIIGALESWVLDTNNDILSYYFARAVYKNIVLIVDEAHLYFNARKWDKGGLMERLDILLTQCRKRNIKIFFISQRLKRVDINIRRMTDFVVRYKLRRIPILGIQWSSRSVYENEGDLADIQGDDSKTYVMNKDSNSFWTDIEKSKIEWWLFLPLLKVFWLPLGKRLSQGQLSNFVWEEHNSYFISWLPVAGTRTEFKESEIFIEEKPYTEQELKIRSWIDDYLPWLKKFLQKLFIRKKQNNGFINRFPVANDQGSNSSSSSDSRSMSGANYNGWLKRWRLSNQSNFSHSSERIDGLRKLRRIKDWLWDVSNVDSSSNSWWGIVSEVGWSGECYGS